MTKIESVKKHGKRTKGKKFLLKHLLGEKLTQNEAILAKCYECEGYYSDGIFPCTCKDCPLFTFNPLNRPPQAV